jgi:AcrR family transcriptional regulator
MIAVQLTARSGLGRATLQQERSRATRQAIIDAAEKLWGERGFDAVSVEEICQEAGVAKGTFYFYFPRKEHLLVILRYDRMTPKEGELQALLSGDLSTLDVCRELVGLIGNRASILDKPLVTRAIEESLKRHREVGRLEGGGRYLRNYFHPIFERGLARGEIDPAWDLDLLAGTSGWTVLQEIFGWSQEQTSDQNFAGRLRQRIELIVVAAATRREGEAAKKKALKTA